MTKEEILHLGTLARIKLTDEEVERFQGEFSEILDYVDELKEITAADGAEETKHAGIHRNILREDAEPHESEKYTEALLSEAPNRDGRYVRVKKILQDG